MKRLLLVSLVLALCLASSALALGTLLANYEAEGFTEGSANVTPLTGSMRWTGTGSAVSAYKNVPQKAVTMTVRTAGRVDGSTVPLLRVYLDNTSNPVLAQKQIKNTSYQTFTFNVNIPAGSHRVVVRPAGMGGGSVLWVDKINFHAAEATTPAPPTRAIGTFTNGGRTDNGTFQDNLAAYNSKVGKNAEIVLWFEEFGQYNISVDKFNHVRSTGAVPMVTLQPYLQRERGGATPFPNDDENPLRAINSGKYDAWTESLARNLNAYGGTVYVRFAHEMNGVLASSGQGWYPWGYNSGFYATKAEHQAEYRKAFQRVSSTLKANAPDANVEMVFAPNVERGQTPLRDYYPGDVATDILALDGYDFNHGQDSCAEVFTNVKDGVVDPQKPNSYANLAALHPTKPMMIAETGTGPSVAADGQVVTPEPNKPAWIRDLYLDCVPNKMPRVESVVWFDTNKERDWRVDSAPHPGSLNAYKEAVNSPGWSRNISN